MICEKCKHKLFTIEVNNTCENCVHNGAYDEDNNLIYDDKEIEKLELKRFEVEENGTCSFGTAYGPGCWIFTCGKCGQQKYMPLTED
jgi:DNA-directed RNA polymerase subunit M/transcription elongation factor TFIIS